MRKKNISRKASADMPQLFCHKCGAEIPQQRPPAARPPKRGRSDDRFQEIAGEMKEKIVSGTWRPEARIPTRRQLCAQYGASPITIQNIIDQFDEDGFLVSDGRNGTRVTKSPPHLTNIAIAFPDEPRNNRFWNALSNVAREKRSDGIRIIQRENIRYNGWTDSSEQVELVKDVIRKRLAGIFFASAPFLVDRTPIVTEPGIPRCAFMTPGQYPEISVVTTDGDSFLHKSLSYLKSKGRRRTAVIGHPGISQMSWLKKIGQYGLESGPYWIQGMSISDVLPGCNLARLLFHGTEAGRPDGLVITDDNIVGSVTKGIAESGVKVPGDLDIVAHCNFPCLPPSSVPVVYLGYDAREILEKGIQFLRAMRVDGAPAKSATVKALFQNELARR